MCGLPQGMTRGSEPVEFEYWRQGRCLIAVQRIAMPPARR